MKTIILDPCVWCVGNLVFVTGVIRDFDVDSEDLKKNCHCVSGMITRVFILYNDVV